jgi:MFS family permease
VFAFGAFIFAELFSLYLLHRGMSHRFVGGMTLVQMIGGVTATFAATPLLRTLGPRSVVMLGTGGWAVFSALRGAGFGEEAILILTGLAGVLFSLWTITIPVVIAQVTTPANRNLGFSLFFAASIGSGVVADAVGGELPERVAGWTGAKDTREVLGTVLLLSGGVSALAVIAARGLNVRNETADWRLGVPRTWVLRWFFAALAVWTVAVSTLTPFISALLEEYLGETTRELGWVESMGELAGAAALLAAPWLVRRLSARVMIPCAMLGTGVAMIFLGAVTSAGSVMVVYSSFMALQLFSQPWLNSFVMSQVSPAERAGIASFSALILFAGQGVGSAVGGEILEEHGYWGLLLSGSIVAVTAATLFLALLLRLPAGIAAALEETATHDQRRGSRRTRGVAP